MKISKADPGEPQISRLLREHLNSMAQYSPPESVHALDVEALRAPDITFWAAWQGTDLLGCGALRELDAEHAEVKSMRTVSKHLRKGVARAILLHLLDEAKRRSYKRLSLETGSAAAFVPAQKLYLAAGFDYCGPFAGYAPDPFSVFMTKTL